MARIGRVWLRGTTILLNVEGATVVFISSGTIGTLILLVAYVLTTVGAIRLVFVQRTMPVPMWQIMIPLAALLVLGYRFYRNVIPYPSSGAAQWFPIVSGGWLVIAVIAVLVCLGRALAENEGISLAESTRPGAVAAPDTSG